MSMKLFCCCLPVRLGVFVLSIVTFVFSVVLSIGGWSAFAMYMSTLSVGENVGISLASLSYSLLCLFSIAGFVGTIMRSLPLVSSYSRMLFGQWIFDLAVNIASLVIWLRFAQNVLIPKCISGTGDFVSNMQGNFSQDDSFMANPVLTNPLISDPNTRAEVCQAGLTTFKVVLIVTLVIYKLITLYGCIISHRYVVQLRQERTEQRWHDIERKVDGMQNDRMRLPGAGAV